MKTSHNYLLSQQRQPINVLFSSTRGWNCGDEFILAGIRNLIDDLGVAINPVVYNRHPDLLLYEFLSNERFYLDTPNGQFPLDIENILRRYSCRADNSVRLDHDLGFVDACIFAGTPEWLGPPVERLVTKLAASPVPVAYLGVGYGDYQASAADSLGDADAAILRRARLITTRDKRAGNFLNQHGISSRLLPCPALFACRDEKPVERIRRVAISLQNPNGAGPQTISKASTEWLLDFARKAASEYEVIFVQHYIDDCAKLYSELSSIGSVFYSCEPRDYERFYRGADLTVTSRVHGAGFCASMGIPAYYVGDSLRTDTVDGFLSKIVPIGSTPPSVLIDNIRSVDVGDWSRRIIDHKLSIHSKYIILLSDFLSRLV